jgi:hypothetical protein
LRFGAAFFRFGAAFFFAAAFLRFGAAFFFAAAFLRFGAAFFRFGAAFFFAAAFLRFGAALRFVATFFLVAAFFFVAITNLHYIKLPKPSINKQLQNTSFLLLDIHRRLLSVSSRGDAAFEKNKHNRACVSAC